MSRRGWVGWLEEHRGVVAGLAFWSVMVSATVAAVATGSTAGPAGGPFTAPSPARSASSPGATHAPPTHEKRKATVAGGKGGSTASPSAVTSSPPPLIAGRPPIVPGTSGLPPCRPSQPKAANGQPETGVTSSTVTIGQIVTDSSNLPGQFRPAYEGLSAYMKLANDGGGICGRTLVIDYDNDQSNPSTHDFAAMAQRDFAFVGNFSLLDSQDYGSSKPFLPKYRDTRTNEYVPDVGGLAFSYNRSQSAWHAGVIGSVSPVLVGGGQFKFFIDRAAAQGSPCTKAGTVYLVEPTGASQDQAAVGGAALAAPWGGNLGSSNVKTYSASLAAPDLVYRGIIENMIRDGVNCVFSYTDVASNINLAKALDEEGVWPPDKCTRTIRSQCFSVVWVSFTGYDASFVRDGGEGARDVVSFIPQLPLNETANPALRSYLAALSALKASDGRFADAEPSAFSVLGFASGLMFGEALAACGGAPTRACVMDRLRHLENFTAGGLLGGVTPFRTTRADYGSYGTFDWKWIFYSSVAVQVLGDESDYLARWHRIRPSSGFFHDVLHVAR